MAKISPVSIKYMIHASFASEGALEKPDVIGAIFGQTEGLLGSDLEMRDLQKEGKIGRIEVELERKDKRTTGMIKVPTALDQSETTLIAAAIETIERIGPCDSQIEVEKIEDVRGSKRDYIIERAKNLMKGIEGSTDSREISGQVKDFARTSEVQEYGEDKLPYGELFGKELIVVEGRADVLNLLRNGIKNVIAMNGTKLPSAIKELGKEKEITLYVDGDRGGELIIKNVVDNANIKYIAVAPDGKEVEELMGKEIHMNLRKRISVDEFFRGRKNFPNKIVSSIELDDNAIDKLKGISEKNSGSKKAILLDESLNQIREVSAKSGLRNLKETPYVIVIDGAANNLVIRSAEDAGCKALVANNFATTDTSMKLISF